MDAPNLQPLADGVNRCLASDYDVSVWVFHIHIRAGFITDGASIPELLQRWAGKPFDFPRIIAALVHDWLYAAHVTSRWFADLIFLALMIKSGCPKWRSVCDWWAVRKFGGIAWRGHGEQDEIFAREFGLLTVTYNEED